LCAPTSNLYFIDPLGHPLLKSNPGKPNVSGAFRNYANKISGITLAHGDYRTFVYDEVRIGSSYAAVIGTN
jgi:hypothetical protein